MKNLTIITIAKDVDDSLSTTYKSISNLLEKGANWLVVLSQKSKNADYLHKSNLILGKDKSLYNALNIGLDKCQTEWFIFLHSGDSIIDIKTFLSCFELVRLNEIDLILGGQKIGDRVHLSSKWKPWMFSISVQPPHLPIIYRTSFVGSTRFSEKIPVVADFYMLRELFLKKPKFIHTKKIYISMETGGLTSSGFSSIVRVTKSFLKQEGFFKTILKTPLRIFFKILLK